MRNKTRQILMIDGYNIINAWSELKVIAQASLEEARIALISLLSEYRSFSGQEVWLVFDAYHGSSKMGAEEEIQGIKVVYTKEKQTADSYIEIKVKHLASERNLEVRVATSDYAVQQSILGNGGSRVSARELYIEINEQVKKIHQTTKELKIPGEKLKLSDQIDEKTKGKLLELFESLKGQ